MTRAAASLYFTSSPGTRPTDPGGTGVVAHQIRWAPVSLRRGHQLSQVLFVLGERHLLLAFGDIHEPPLLVHVLQVVQSPVEVDDIPMAIPQPGVDLGQAAGRRTTVGRNAMDVRFSFELLPHWYGVPDRDRIADQQDPGQIRVIHDLRERRVGRSALQLGGGGITGEQSEAPWPGQPRDQCGTCVRLQAGSGGSVYDFIVPSGGLLFKAGERCDRPQRCNVYKAKAFHLKRCPTPLDA